MDPVYEHLHPSSYTYVPFGMAKHIPDEAEAYKKHVQPEKWVAEIAFLMQALMDSHALNDRLFRRVEGRCTWMLFDHRAFLSRLPYAANADESRHAKATTPSWSRRVTTRRPDVFESSLKKL